MRHILRLFAKGAALRSVNARRAALPILDGMITHMQDNVLVPTRSEGVVLDGILGLPRGACGLVVFAHGSGSGRLSPRNQFLAGALQGEGLATLLFDLLTEDEAADRANVFDIPLLAERVTDAIGWARAAKATALLPVGIFGGSTGAAAALSAATTMPDVVKAVVSRGGRPDMAMDVLHKVKAATLLIVGGADYQVIELNEAAYRQLNCEKRLEIVPGATHLFEEPGALEAVASHACAWFTAHLV